MKNKAQIKSEIESTLKAIDRYSEEAVSFMTILKQNFGYDRRIFRQTRAAL